jgi:hypothetical protein
MKKMSRAMQLAASATAGALLLGGGFALAEGGDVPADEEAEEVVDPGEEIDPADDVVVGDDDNDGNDGTDNDTDGTDNDGTDNDGTDTDTDGTDGNDTDGTDTDGTDNDTDGTDGNDDGVQEEQSTEIAPTDTEDEATDEEVVEEWRNHGHYVSEVARSTPPGPGRGLVISEAARSDVGKPAQAGGPPAHAGGNAGNADGNGRGGRG